jgi:type VI secretion system secreted protein Hcp
MAADYFLKIDGIPGEAKDATHKDEIQILSIHLAAENGAKGMGRKPVVAHIAMGVSKAGPKLFLACATGQHIPSAVVTGRKAGGKQETFITFSFLEVMVSRYHIGAGHVQDMRNAEELITLYDIGTGPGIDPKEFITIDFAMMRMTYNEQKADGKLGPKTEVMYNLKENKAS